MRPCVREDRIRCAVTGQHLDDVANVAAFVRPRVQLAVGVGAGTAFAEAIVAVEIDDAVLGEALEITPSRLHGLAAIDDDRRDPTPRELVRAEQTGGPATDDHDGWAGYVAERRPAQRLGRRRADDDMKPDPPATSVDRPLANFDRGQGRQPEHGT